MKKLLLTVAISGLLTTGALADVRYSVRGCPTTETIAEHQKKKGNVGQFSFTDEHGNIWAVFNQKTEPKSLTSANAGLATNDGVKFTGFTIECHYDNGVYAHLYKKNCKNMND